MGRGCHGSASEKAQAIDRRAPSQSVCVQSQSIGRPRPVFFGNLPRSLLQASKRAGKRAGCRCIKAPRRTGRGHAMLHAWRCRQSVNRLIDCCLSFQVRSGKRLSSTLRAQRQEQPRGACGMSCCASRPDGGSSRPSSKAGGRKRPAMEEGVPGSVEPDIVSADGAASPMSSRPSLARTIQRAPDHRERPPSPR